MFVKVKVKLLSHVRLFATPWTVAYQAPQPMEFSRQEYWSALPFPSPGDLPKPGIKPRSPELQADALPSEPPGKPKVCLGGCKLKALKLWHTQQPNERDCTHISEKAMAPNPSTLAWKIPWMEKSGGLQSMGSLRVGHD